MAILAGGIGAALQDGVIVGGGSRDPRIFFVACGESRDPIAIADFSDQGFGFSFYAADLSPDHNFLAVASRPIYDPPGDPRGTLKFPSIMRVYPLLGAEAEQLTLKHSWFVYENSGVSAVLIEDDGGIWLGCGDGSLKAFTIHAPATSPSVQIQAHDGWVLALTRTTTGRVASFGADGKLAVWNLATGAEEASASSISCPPLGALMSLAWHETMNTVFCGSETGDLHALSVVDGEHRSIPAHDGGIAAVTVHPETDQLVTGGVEDQFLRIAEPGTLEQRCRVAVGAPVYGLVPLPGRRLVCLDGSGRVTVWTLDGEPQCLGTRGTLEARSWAGPNVAAYAAELRHKEVGDRATARQEFREAIRRQELERAEELVERMRSLGAGGQALVAEAALYRARGQLLNEFLVWRTMETAEGDSMPISARFLQAENLALLQEPALAAEKFEALGDYRDAKERAGDLRSHPLTTADLATLVRGDFRKPEQVLEELDKQTLLEHRFAETLVIKATRPTDLLEEVSVETLAHEIQKRYDGTAGGEWKIHAEERSLFVGGSVRDLQWVRISRNEDSGALSALQYALEIAETPGGARRVGYALFTPGSDVQSSHDSQDWNAEVGRSWLDIFDSEDAKAWVKRAHGLCTDFLDRLLNVKRARKSGGV